MNQKAVYFIEAAADALKEEILDQIRMRRNATAVPCQEGTDAFSRMVRNYWKLFDMIGKSPYPEVEPIPQMEYAEAMCEAMPSRG